MENLLQDIHYGMLAIKESGLHCGRGFDAGHRSQHVDSSGKFFAGAQSSACGP